jgi:hypothetical protein
MRAVVLPQKEVPRKLGRVLHSLGAVITWLPTSLAWGK